MTNAQRFAISLMIAQAVLFAGETAAIHQIGPQMPAMLVGLCRAAGGVMLAVVLAGQAGLAVMRTRQLTLQLLRGAVSLLYLWVMIYSFSYMPFADATAISYTQVAYIAVFSVLILGETVSAARWSAAMIAVAGALLIAQPGFAGWNIVYLVAIAGTSLNGLAFVLNRYLQREDSEATTMFYSNLVPLLGNVPILALAGLPAADCMLWLPGIVLLGPLGMFAGIVAVRHADAAMLAPYTLLRLVIAILGGLLIFREATDGMGLLGAGLIIAGCILSARAGTATPATSMLGRARSLAPSWICLQPAPLPER